MAVQVQVNQEVLALTVPTQDIQIRQTMWLTIVLIPLALFHPTGKRLTQRKARCTSSITVAEHLIGSIQDCPESRKLGQRIVAMMSFHMVGNELTILTMAPTSSITSTDVLSMKILFLLPRLQTRVPVTFCERV